MELNVYINKCVFSGASASKETCETTSNQTTPHNVHITAHQTTLHQSLQIKYIYTPHTHQTSHSIHTKHNQTTYTHQTTTQYRHNIKSNTYIHHTHIRLHTVSTPNITKLRIHIRPPHNTDTTPNQIYTPHTH